MALLQKKDYGATGTCRANSGVVQDLIDKKNTKKPKTFFLEKVFSKQLAVTIKCVSLHRKTMDWFFFQSTVHTENKQLIQHLKKRLGKIFSKSKTAWVPFSDKARAKFLVLAIADDYNYNMNHVNQGNHFKARNCGAKTVKKRLKALFL